MNYPVCIPSKGRPQNSSTIKKLIEEGICPVVVIEQEDKKNYYDQYADAVEYLTLPKSNQGIVYVRKFIKNYATERGYAWFWMLDDDITGVFVTKKNKTHRIKFKECLTAAEKHFEKSDIFIGGLEYQQFAWSAKSMYAKNSYCEVFVLVNTERTKNFTYYDVGGKEDRDFVLQGLAMGMDSLRIRKLSFACPKNGANKGGLKEIFYDQDGHERQASELMVKRWPGVCTMNIKKDGRPDVKINWRLFKRSV